MLRSGSRLRARWHCLGIVALILFFLPSAFATNIVLLIGDGMGPEQVKAAGFLAHGRAGSLMMETLPVKGWVRTDSATTSTATDSAAAATAMAAGRKVNNGVLSQAIPGDGTTLTTILQDARAAGWSTGLVTTSYIVDATPAAFAAHSYKRGTLADIARAYLQLSRPDLLLGGGDKAIPPSLVHDSGYAVAVNREQLLSLDAITTVTHLAGIFGTVRMPYELDGLGDLPHLREMTAIALRRLSRNPKGFFVMIEGGRIDHAGHSNDLPRNIAETIEFDRAIEVVLDWVRDHPDTLVIVTADHETGGLQVAGGNGVGYLPTARWTTTKHTAVNVPLYARGPNSAALAGEIENTRIYEVMKETLREAMRKEKVRVGRPVPAGVR